MSASSKDAQVALIAVTGIDTAGKRYEPGDTLSVVASTATWLIDCGHARLADVKEVSR